MFLFCNIWGKTVYQLRQLECGNLKASEGAGHFGFNLKMLLRFAVNELCENECGSTEFSCIDEMFSSPSGVADCVFSS